MNKPTTAAPYPKHLEIETTNLCNLACPFCPHPKMERKKGLMDWQTLYSILDQSRGKGVKTCYMHMIGEPLIHPQIIDMIDVVSGEGIWTSISTNAMLLDADMQKNIIHSKLDEVTLALDSLNPETYSKLRVKGDFEQVFKNINEFLQRRFDVGFGPKVELQVIVMKENVHEIPKYKELFNPIIELINQNVTDPRRKSWLRIKGFSTFANQVPDMSPEPTEPLRFRCKKLWESIAIHWNGDISLCCRDAHAVQVIGNVKKDRIHNIWQSQDFELLRKLHRENRFGDHDLLKLCENC